MFAGFLQSDTQTFPPQLAKLNVIKYVKLRISAYLKTCGMELLTAVFTLRLSLTNGKMCGN